MSKWPMVLLKELMGDRIESVDPSKHPDELFDLYSVPSFDQRHPAKCFGSEIGSSKKLVQPGDVLLSRIVPHIRRSWVVADDDGRRLIASGEWIVFRSSRIDPTWLSHTLVGDTFHTKFMQTVAGVGGSLMRARPSHVASIQIPLPPMQEQRRIAAILDQADALRGHRREARARLSTLSESVFIEMFGELPTELLDQKLAFVTSGGRGWAKFYTDRGRPFIRSLDVRMNSISLDNLAQVSPPDNAEARRTRTQAGDVLLTITGSRIGRAATLPKALAGSYVSQHVAIIRTKPEAVSPEYLSAFLCASSFGQRQISKMQYGQTKPGLNFDQIRQFSIPAACIGLQRTFVDRVRQAQRMELAMQESRTQLDALFASLQARAFAGEL